MQVQQDFVEKYYQAQTDLLLTFADLRKMSDLEHSGIKGYSPFFENFMVETVAMEIYINQLKEQHKCAIEMTDFKKHIYRL